MSSGCMEKSPAKRPRVSLDSLHSYPNQYFIYENEEYSRGIAIVDEDTIVYGSHDPKQREELCIVASKTRNTPILHIFNYASWMILNTCFSYYTSPRNPPPTGSTSYVTLKVAAASNNSLRITLPSSFMALYNRLYSSALIFPLTSICSTVDSIKDTYTFVIAVPSFSKIDFFASSLKLLYTPGCFSRSSSGEGRQNRLRVMPTRNHALLLHHVLLHLHLQLAHL